MAFSSNPPALHLVADHGPEPQPRPHTPVIADLRFVFFPRTSFNFGEDRFGLKTPMLGHKPKGAGGKQPFQSGNICKAFANASR